jgi:hypothetical protein
MYIKQGRPGGAGAGAAAGGGILGEHTILLDCKDDADHQLVYVVERSVVTCVCSARSIKPGGM